MFDALVAAVEVVDAIHHRFAFGGGVRFTIPNLPLGLYLSKGFTIQDGQVVWDRGELFRDPDDETSGLDLVLTINMDMMY